MFSIFKKEYAKYLFITCVMLRKLYLLQYTNEFYLTLKTFLDAIRPQINIFSGITEIMDAVVT